MLQSHLAAELGLAIIIIYFAIIAIQRGIQGRRARRLGCEPVRRELPNDPLGFESILRMLAARRNHTLPNHWIRSMDDVGINAHTIKERYLLSESLHTRDPENIKTILSTQVSHWQLGPIRGGALGQLMMGMNLFTREGHPWKESRSLVRPQFNRSQFSDIEFFDKHVQELLRTISVDSDAWSADLDLQPLFVNLVTDISTEFLLGYSVHTQNPTARLQLPKVENLEVPDPAIFGACLDEASDWMTTIAPLGRWYTLVPLERFKYCVREPKKLIDWLVREALNRNDMSKAQPSPATSAGTRYIMLDELIKSTRDPVVLRDEIMGLIAAGRNTTSSLIGWTIFFLSRHPDVYAKLRNAINDRIGLDPSTPIKDYAALRGCEYLQDCLSESLRLVPPASRTWRQAAQDTTLPNGGGADGTAPVFVPKGTLVVVNIFAVHHRADLYGHDVEEFRPERWESRSKGWDMSPFGGGPRICVGRKFYILSMGDSTIWNKLIPSWIIRATRFECRLLRAQPFGTAI